MTNIDIFLTILGRSQRGINSAVIDLSHSSSTFQLPGKSNCMNWILGHICVYRDIMLMSIGLRSNLDLSAKNMYGYGSSAIGLNGKCINIIELNTLLNNSYSQLIEWLESMTDKDLCRNTPVGISVSKGDTLDEQLASLIAHELIHVGELSSLREAALVGLGKGWK